MPGLASDTTARKNIMSFDFDAGNEGSVGPWLQWSAQKEKFQFRDRDGKVDFKGFDTGVVLDIRTMKTGWSRSDGVAGVAPEWKWNPSLNAYQPKPGDDWKKGFSIRCAISQNDTANWEQAGTGAWNAFVALVPAIQAGPGDFDKLPLVKINGIKTERFARGSTTTPQLEVIKWVDRPACLKEGAAAGIAVDEAPKQPVATATSAPMPADASEF
jgi:hypothetical protein